MRSFYDCVSAFYAWMTGQDAWRGRCATLVERHESRRRLHGNVRAQPECHNHQEEKDASKSAPEEIAFTVWQIKNGR
jgi:hypothetical protein